MSQHGDMSDTSWPLRDVVAKLVEAVDHLMRDHDCDHHGWEVVSAARDAGRKWLAEEDAKTVALAAKYQANRCNRHNDCASADAKAKEKGRLYADHCHNDECEDCFGQ